MSSNMSIPLPNPFTPLAFLPPDIADQVQIAIYITVATLAAYTCEWLIAMPGEYRMCSKGSRGFGLIPYFLSRICAFGVCVTALAFELADVENCHALFYLLAALSIVVDSSTLAMFLLRLKAVYFDRKILVKFFCVLWMSVSGSLFVWLFVPTLSHIGPTKKCVVISVKDILVVPFLLHLAFDALIFIAISFRIVSHSTVSESPGNLRARLQGRGLPHISRCLLQGGQFYYFSTLALNIITSVLILTPVNPALRLMFVIPRFAFDSSMACRVFRGLKLGLIEDIDGLSQMQMQPHSIRFAPNPAATTVSNMETHASDLQSPQFGHPVQCKVEFGVMNLGSGACVDEEKGASSVWV